MANGRRERKVRWITPDQAKARQSVNFDERPKRKERTLVGLLVSISLVILLFGAIILYVIREPGSSGESVNSSLPLPIPEAPELGLDYKTPPVDWTGKLPKEILNDFQHARSIDDYLEHLDQLPLVEKEAREFFENGPGSREKISDFNILPPLHTGDGRTYISLQAVMESGLIRTLFIRWDPSGPKIDFHSYARTSSHSWEDLLSGKVSEGEEMRIGIRPDTFYLGEFQDDSVWQSFRGVIPDHEEHLSLYLRRDQMSEALHRLVKLKRSISVTLSLRSVGKSYERKQFELTKIHQLNWLTITGSKTK